MMTSTDGAADVSGTLTKEPASSADSESLSSQAEQKALLRQNETDEQKAERLRKKREYRVIQRQTETPEETAARRKRERERRAQRERSEPPEVREARRKRKRERDAARRIRLADQSAAKRVRTQPAAVPTHAGVPGAPATPNGVHDLTAIRLTPPSRVAAAAASALASAPVSPSASRAAALLEPASSVGTTAPSVETPAPSVQTHVPPDQGQQQPLLQPPPLQPAPFQPASPHQPRPLTPQSETQRVAQLEAELIRCKSELTHYTDSFGRSEAAHRQTLVSLANVGQKLYDLLRSLDETRVPVQVTPDSLVALDLDPFLSLARGATQSATELHQMRSDVTMLLTLLNGGVPLPVAQENQVDLDFRLWVERQVKKVGQNGVGGSTA